MANPSKILFYKSKGAQDCNKYMRKLKGGMRESKLFDTRIYPVVRLATKAHLHPRCRSTHKEYCFSVTKSLPGTPSHHGHLDPGFH